MLAPQLVPERTDTTVCTVSVPGSREVVLVALDCCDSSFAWMAKVPRVGIKGKEKDFRQAQRARTLFTTDQLTPIAQIFRLGFEPVVRDLTTRLDS